ncbi:MAG: fused MFS/spermidine synthase [Candidatus Eremiobacteraeota bacterium]|nr:fused MFS/spermidine synthase [Candidatus Eremiobacteraeota bacterium]
MIYEILWTRRLNLVFGHSILAVSTVVTAYMGGLALGSVLGGRWADRQLARGQQARWFLATYGRLEGLVGVWAFLSLPLLGLVESFYLSMSARGVQGTTLYLVAFAASLLVLVPPTTAMGATLPVVSCLYHSDSQGVGKNLSRLYSTNTFGAVVGVALAGFGLLPVLGLKLSVALAGLLNLAIAAVSLWVSRGLSGHLEKSSPGEELPLSAGDSGAFILTVGFALSGALSMAAQMAWTRSLTLTLGSSVYAFSVILVVFLTGIAAGSAVFHRWASGRRPEFFHLALITAGVGLSSALAVPALGRLPLLFLHFFPLVRHHYWQVLLLDLCLCALVLIVPTLLMGVTFPLVTQLYHRSCGRLGRSVGNIYSANTLGCILGSSLTGFALIPQIGMERTLQLSAAGFFLVAALYAARGGSRLWMLFCLLGPLCCFTPAWDPSLIYAGLATHGVTMRGADNTVVPHQPAYLRDGLSGSVSVLIWQPGGITMRVNGKPEASLGLSDRLPQTYLGLVPLLYVQNPKRVGVIGLGSGLTLKAAAAAPSVESAECAELEPYVIEAERYFAPYNDHVAQDPRMKLRYADGRTMVMGDSGKFDCIVSVPSNPWVAGIGNLYTQDFYQSARSKLSPGGVFMQWVNLYALSPKDLQTVVQTFGSVFPEAQLWALGGDLALVGGATEIKLDGIRRYYEASSYLRHELIDLGLKRPEQLIGNYACPLKFAIQNEPKVPLNTDDNPCLEYSAPLSLYNLESFSANVAWVAAARQRYHQLPAGLPNTPEMRLEAALGSLAFTAFADPLTLNPAPPGWAELARICRTNVPAAGECRQWLERFGNWTEGRIWLAQHYRKHGQMREALECVPEKPESLADAAERGYWLNLRASIRLEQQDWQGANQDYARAYELRPFCDFSSAQAYCLVKLKHWSEAELMVARALQENPYDVRAFLVQGLMAMHQGRDEDALRSLQRVCRECPFIQEAWLRSAEILARRGDRPATRKVIQDYLVFYPEDKGLRNLLQQL